MSEKKIYASKDELKQLSLSIANINESLEWIGPEVDTFGSFLNLSSFDNKEVISSFTFKNVTAIDSFDEDNTTYSKNIYVRNRSSITDANDQNQYQKTQNFFSGILPDENLAFFGSEFKNESVPGNESGRTFTYDDNKKYDFEEFSGCTVVAGTKAVVGPYGARSLIAGSRNICNARGAAMVGYNNQLLGSYWRSYSSITWDNTNKYYQVKIYDYTDPSYADDSHHEFNESILMFFKPQDWNEGDNPDNFTGIGVCSLNGSTYTKLTGANPKINAPWLYKGSDSKLKGVMTREEIPDGFEPIHLPERENYVYYKSSMFDGMHAILYVRIRKTLGENGKPVIDYAYDAEWSAKYNFVAGYDSVIAAPASINIGSYNTVGSESRFSTTIGNKVINKAPYSVVISGRNGIKSGSYTICHRDWAGYILLDSEGADWREVLKKIIIRNTSLSTIINTLIEEKLTAKGL